MVIKLNYINMCKGIPTIYKGIEMKSRLEANVAFFFDLLKIKWKYEPQSFLLSDGEHYLPDFYLPELKCFVEVKGIITDEVIKKMEIFVKEYKKELLLISSENGYYIELWDNGEFEIGDTIQIGKCSNCNSFFFCNNIGSWYCRKCGSHNGDHDIIDCDMFDDFCITSPNFSQIKSIIEYVNTIKKGKR